MQVHHPVGGQFGSRFKLIADDPLAANDVKDGADLPRFRDAILGSQL